MKQYTFLYLSLIVVTQVLAQPKEFIPRYFVGKDSTLYWNKNLPVFIKLSSTPEDEGINLISKEQRQYSNPVFLDTEGPNYIRTKYAVDKDTREVKNPKVEVLFEVVSDGVAPSSQIILKDAKHFLYNTKNYYGKGLTYELIAQDRYSGVEGIYSAIDGDHFNPYERPIPISQEGEHIIKYHSADQVGNTEIIKSETLTIDITAPSITHNINGISDSNTIAGSSTLYLTASDNLSGVAKSFYRFDDRPFAVYTGNRLDLNSLEDGDHRLEYYAEDNVGNRSEPYTFDFYYDKLAPLTATDIIGDKFLYQDKVYFSGRTKMKLTAIDNKAGVKEIKYSIDNTGFKTYEDPFYLPSIQGNHVIKFYSVDRLSNQPGGAEEYKHNINLVYLDLTGPDLTYSISGPSFSNNNQLYIGPLTSLHLIGKDLQSGLQYLSYSVDGQLAETRYDKPFFLSTTSGSHKIELFGYDNVNNRNISQVNVNFDGDPPLILNNFSVGSTGSRDAIAVYPGHMVLFLAATDTQVGNDKIYYQINNTPEQLYSNALTNWQPGKKYDIKIRSVDKVGNESGKTISFFIAEK